MILSVEVLSSLVSQSAQDLDNALNFHHCLGPQVTEGLQHDKETAKCFAECGRNFQSRRDLSQCLHLFEGVHKSLVRIHVTRPAKLPGFIDTQRCRPCTLEYPILICPGSGIPRGFCLWYTSLVANSVPDWPLVLCPFSKRKFYLGHSLSRKLFLEFLV